MEKKVTGCENCPFFQELDDRIQFHCMHPIELASNRRLIHIEEGTREIPYKEGNSNYPGTWPMRIPITPDNCPLKSEPLTIIFSS
jgi:hypothetical protein